MLLQKCSSGTDSLRLDAYAAAQSLRKSEETASASELWMTGTFAWPSSKKLQTRVGSGLRGSPIALVAARSKTWLGAIPLSPAASLDTLRQAARTVGKLAGLCQDAAQSRILGQVVLDPGQVT